MKIIGKICFIFVGLSFLHVAMAEIQPDSSMVKLPKSCEVSIGYKESEYNITSSCDNKVIKELKLVPYHPDPAGAFAKAETDLSLNRNDYSLHCISKTESYPFYYKCIYTLKN